METGHSDTTTKSIRVQVAAQLVPEQSDPEQDTFLYAYRVVITNDGDTPVQLISRHWVITDGDGEKSEVQGPGVVGEQPMLPPGESFEYMSGCPLPTPWGTMEGSYLMRPEDGADFEAHVGRFFLAETVAPITELDG